MFNFMAMALAGMQRPATKKKRAVKLTKEVNCARAVENAFALSPQNVFGSNLQRNTSQEVGGFPFRPVGSEGSRGKDQKMLLLIECSAEEVDLI
jgi:hypothetical protein